MPTRFPKTLIRWLPVCIAAALLVANAWYLWKPLAEDVSGDTLIHLIFARNRVDGHPNEFNVGEKSRALTSVLWNVLLAGTGRWTGLVHHQQGFLDLARVLAVILTLLAALVGWRMIRRWGAEPWAAWVAVGFCVASPVTFYWCVANPMETALAVLLAVLMLDRVERAARLGGWMGDALVLAVLGFALLVNRPELAVLSGLGAGSVVLARWGDGWRRCLRFLLVFASVWAGLLVMGWWMSQALDLPLLPNAVSARRLIIQLRDSQPLPGLGIPFNKDAWLFVLLCFPVWAGLHPLWKTGGAGGRAVALFVIGSLLFVAAFFSFYFCTTWQGRYLLPVLWMIWLAGWAGWSRWLAERQRGEGWMVVGALALMVVTGGVMLPPLAGFAQAPHYRTLVNREHVVPGPEVKTILLQEIQAAWFHPGVRYVCTEGLIALETERARQEGWTAYEFVRSVRPDWMGVGRYPLPDPDGLEAAIDRAAAERRDFQVRDLRGVYLGNMAGGGPVFRVDYSGLGP